MTEFQVILEELKQYDASLYGRMLLRITDNSLSCTDKANGNFYFYALKYDNVKLENNILIVNDCLALDLSKFK